MTFLKHGRTARPAAALAALTLILAACGSGAGASEGSNPEGDALRVVATTTVFADLVHQVGGDLVEVTSLIPAGGDPHTFEPTPTDASAVGDADLLVMNGLGMDEWLRELTADAGAENVPVVELAEDLEGVEYLEGHEHGHEGEEGHAGESHAEGEEGHDHEGEAANPHLWLNVEYAVKYVERIVAALSAADPDDAETYASQGDAYIAELEALNAEIGEQMESIPDENRRIISFHEAFPYFAEAYGLTIVGTVIEVPGQDPSAGEVTELLDAIEEEGASAIFTEAQFPTSVAERISEESGIPIVGTLYNDSLGEPPADTYVGMMRWNVDQVVQALGE
jgi:ABC-type Zn uptake system ZnuABC Zn-binding protein ZnuA